MSELKKLVEKTLEEASVATQLAKIDTTNAEEGSPLHRFASVKGISIPDAIKIVNQHKEGELAKKTKASRLGKIQLTKGNIR